MTTLCYRTPSNRSRRLLSQLASRGVNGEIVRRPILSPDTDVVIDVDDAEAPEVAKMIRELEPLASPVAFPRQR